MPDLVDEILKKMRAAGLKLAAAESCTGGLIAAAMTDIAGSSDVFERGFVTYSNEAKMELLGVPEDMLKEYGAVSAPVAEAMAQGALKHSHADLAVSCTGIAGPGGGSDTKPVGLVYIGVALKDHPVKSFEHRFQGDRDTIRLQTVGTALRHVLDTL